MGPSLEAEQNWDSDVEQEGGDSLGPGACRVVKMTGSSVLRLQPAGMNSRSDRGSSLQHPGVKGTSLYLHGQSLHGSVGSQGGSMPVFFKNT